MEDSAIISLYWNRNEQAIAETAEKYGAFCYRIAWNILSCKEDSEECVNDTYLNAWNAIPPQRPKVFPAYLSRITRNLAINRYHFLSREKRGGGEVALALEELQECAAPGSSVEEAIEVKLLGEAIARFLEKISPTERIIFLRRYWYLDDRQSIADFCGLTDTNVGTILSRTRKKLKDHLRKEGFAL